MIEQEASIAYINSIKELLELVDTRIRKQGGISYEQFYILYLLTKDSQLTSKAIAQIAKVSPPAVSRKLNVLMQKGLIKKIYGQSKDQREIQIQVTKKGEAVTKNIINRYNEILNNNVNISKLALETKRVKALMNG
ncbi:MarR family winged helix-turn-helix transcriptional regulator [Latilactobacillus sakei]|uniref:MarR family winged helix-turn-helix transcriptional regulator n=1 Tax=Latilactobacillus sakei TaxID=1599 RepID=UPI000DC645EF|nr:MarR family transcriptional regulator [Latilactobacillus sakei]SPS03250.1 MarR family protein [Latilactobacillus sakei]